MTIRSRLKETFGIAEVDPDTRAHAISEPGPSWAEWARGPLAKTYLALGYFVADILLVVTGLNPVDPIVFAGLLLALYLEYLLWQYLWYRPNFDRESRSGTFQPTFLRPARFGRWTPEGDRARAGVDPFGNEIVGPDPDEFL
jgi:hypothetical protein